VPPSEIQSRAQRPAFAAFEPRFGSVRVLFRSIGRLHAKLRGFFAFLEPEVRGGEAVIACDVDEGLPFGVGELYAYLAPPAALIRYPTTPLYPRAASTLPDGRGYGPALLLGVRMPRTPVMGGQPG